MNDPQGQSGPLEASSAARSTVGSAAGADASASLADGSGWGWQINLTADEAETLRDCIGDDEAQAVVLSAGLGHSGWGMYAWSEEYPEEGAVMITSLPAPTDDESPAEEALRSLACWLGVGGYNAPTVDAALYEKKIREGFAIYSQLHGFAARDLAELVLDMGMVTEKGIRARELARKVLGLLPLRASDADAQNTGSVSTTERAHE